MRYFPRALKYLLSLCVAYFAALYLMWSLDLMLLSPLENLDLLLRSQRGMLMCCAIVALSAAYPFFGFMRKRTYGNILRDRAVIIEVMSQQGFRLLSERDGSLRFVGNNFLKRLGMLFEDHIVVEQHDNADKIVLCGNRKAIAHIIFRLESAIDRAYESQGL